MKKVVYFFLILFVPLQWANAESALAFVRHTRLVMLAQEKAVSFPVQNKTNRTYLLNATVKEYKDGKVGEVVNDFLVAPEVLRLRPKSNQEIQVMRVGGQLPRDRESVFYLSGVFIPGGDRTNRKGGKLDLAFEFNVKLFYRPKELSQKYVIDKIADRLTFSYENKRLKVCNPTGYWMTFADLTFDNRSLMNKGDVTPMVPPKGCQQYELSLTPKKKSRVTWLLIDELGNPTKENSVEL